jgi:hypothetical protein
VPPPLLLLLLLLLLLPAQSPPLLLLLLLLLLRRISKDVSSSNPLVSTITPVHAKSETKETAPLRNFDKPSA